MVLHQTAFSFHITKQFRNSAQNLCRLGPQISLLKHKKQEGSVSRLSHLDGTETDFNVSVNVIFSTLIRIFV